MKPPPGRDAVMIESGDQLSKDLSLAEFRQFRDYIHEHSGIYLEESKLDSLRISLVTRATRFGCGGWDGYFETLSRDETEFRELMSLITINETSFFRFPGQFEALRTMILPEIARDREGDSRTIRMWSAGCSTGEEPYSIAMTYLDSGLEAMGWRGEVMGTDVSTRALSVARTGVYPAQRLAAIPGPTVARHFIEERDSYRIAAHVRRICDFSFQNLVKEPFPLAIMGNWDVIFCRNVTIYFRLESTRRVVQNFYDSLNEGGYLFVGHSETLTSVSDKFESVETGGVFLYRKPRVRRLISAPTPETTRGRGNKAPAKQSGKPDKAEAEKIRATRRVARMRSADAAAQRSEAEKPSKAGSLERLEAAYELADAGEFDLALEECRQALALNPLLPAARYLMGVIHLRQGDVAHAVGEFKKTVYIDPEFVLAHFNLANIYKADGRLTEASREYENSLRAVYKSPEGEWTRFMGGWKPDVILRTCERSLIECRKATGTA